MSMRGWWLRWLRGAGMLALAGVAALPVEGGDRRVVLIGVNQYQPESKLAALKYAVNDVQDLRESLLATGYAEDEIVMLTSDAGEAELRPERERILEAIEGGEQPEGGRGKSIVVVYAGHGFNSNGESFLCPADFDVSRREASSLAVAEIVRMLADAPYDTKYLIADACRNDGINRESSEFNLTSGLQKMRLGGSESAEGIVLFSSCLHGQQSWEDDTLQNGVYLHFISQGLRGLADRDVGDFNGEVTAAELSEYASRETLRYVRSNHDDSQRPWADIHATGELVLTRLSAEQQAALGTVKRRTIEEVNNELESQERVAEGVGMIISRANQAAVERFTMAIEKCNDNYMARRLRALMYVLEGNGNSGLAANRYQLAVADMLAVESRLRVPIPKNVTELPLRGRETLQSASSSTSNYRSYGSYGGYGGYRSDSRVPSLTTVRPGDVLEVDEVVQAGGQSWLKVAAIRRRADVETGNSSIEKLVGYVQLASVANPAASEAQLQDFNRLRKPTVNEFAGMNRRNPAVAQQRATRVADGLGTAALITSQIPGASRAAPYLGTASGFVRMFGGRRRR